MSKRLLVAISLLTFVVTASCARPFSPPQVPPTVPPADHTVHVIAKDKIFGGCQLDVRPNRVNARRNQTIRWVLTVEDTECLSSDALVKIVMKWKDCRGRPNSEEPLDLTPPGMGNQVGTVKAGATQNQCLEYGVFAGSLYKDPELIIDL